MEPHHQPPTTSSTIITSVMPTTTQVRRSVARVSVRKSWLWFMGLFETGAYRNAGGTNLTVSLSFTLYSAPPFPIPMRRLLFAVTIALLLVRGWVGNAMAVEMALGHGVLSHAAVAAADDQHAHHSDMATPHAMAASAESHDCCNEQPSCNTCELCHLAAAWSLVAPRLPVAGHSPFVAALPAVPASTTLAPGLKPPIS